MTWGHRCGSTKKKNIPSHSFMVSNGEGDDNDNGNVVFEQEKFNMLIGLG